MATTSTTIASYVPRGSVDVELNFFEPPRDGSVPFQYAEQPPAGEPASNYSRPIISLKLTDIRGQEGSYTLDQNAFQCLQGVLSATTYDTFLSNDHIKQTFYPEVERLLLDQVEGAHRVVIFHHTVRMDHKDNPVQHKPLLAVHADQTVKSTAADVRRHIPDPSEAELLLRGRYRVINIWKPLNGPVEACPLAFASGCSVDECDVFPLELRFPKYKSETAGVRYNPSQKWMYWSGMANDECLLLKCSDSNRSVPSFQVPHSAFIDPRSHPGAKARESIEVRALVFG
ncbi:hypothetical protein FE257_008094 [Aspergillus nanangensis]|uniref:Methyltransferase n=1 Tax=Aspergillus nanangensis TaxID=2582783 RepID=A0AAD4GTS2_ASPNN|nr:hypothetical protein FE257_008094 [Aspergillus nanangensis]